MVDYTFFFWKKIDPKSMHAAMKSNQKKAIIVPSMCRSHNSHICPIKLTLIQNVLYIST